MQLWVTAGSMNTGSNRRLALISAAGAIAAGVALLSPVRMGVVRGRSMEPTLHENHPFLYSRVPSARTPERGEVVLVRVGQATLVKRVLAVGGEHFWTVGAIKENLTGCRILAVNAPVRAWRKRWPHFAFRRVDVPPGHVFVLGDGLSSIDSRHVGPIPVAAVLGRVLMPEDETGISRVAWTAPPPGPSQVRMADYMSRG